MTARKPKVKRKPRKPRKVMLWEDHGVIASAWSPEARVFNEGMK